MTTQLVLTKTLSDLSGTPRYQVKKVLRHLRDAVLVHAAEGVMLYGFGAFSVKDMPSRTGRNPITGESVFVPSKKKLKFRVAGKVKKILNPAVAA